MQPTNRQRTLTAALVLALVLPAALLLFPVAQATPATSGVRLLHSTATGALLELTTSHYSLTTEQQGTDTFDRLDVPGAAVTTAAGRPQLPVFQAVVGVPAGARVELRVLDDDAVALTEQVNLLPAPRPAPRTDDWEAGKLVYVADKDAYANAAPYPLTTARVADDAWLRSQRIVRVELFPFQYHAAQGTLQWHRRLQVEVRWDGAAVGPVAAAPSDAFEPVLHDTLINYQAAKAWRVAPAHPSLSNPTRPSAGETVPRYKIVVDHDGMYRLSYADLAAAGIDPATFDPRSLGMTSQGKAVAIRVLGEGDGRFDPSDAVIFYGEQFRSTAVSDTLILGNTLVTSDTIASRAYSLANSYTNNNVYWLRTDGIGPQVRMPVLDGTPSGTAPVPTSFRTTVRAEQAHFWWTFHFTSRDTWLWDRIQTGAEATRTYTTTLVAPANEGVVAVRGELIGRNYNDGAAPDHRTRVTLNDPGTVVEDMTWDGFGVTRHRFQGQLAPAALRDGENELSISVIKQPALGAEDMFFDWFEVEYNRRFQADHDQLSFGGDNAGRWQYTPDGFSTPALEAYDISTPTTPQLIANSAVSASGVGYRLAFEANHAAGARYLAVATPGLQRAKQITRIILTSLRSGANGADYIFVAPHDFLAATQTLADYRASQGLRTTVVDLDDVINEFNDGIYHPVAIKRLLAYAYANWQAPAPAYVLLVGDGHWNLKSYGTERYGAPPPQWMPPNLAWVDPYQGEVDSANLLAAIVGDDIIPDLAIGRLPVNNVSELQAVIAKIVAYEAAPPQPWQQHLLFVADNVPDAAGNFRALSDDFINEHLPTGFQADRVYLNDYCGTPSSNPCPDANSAITNALNTSGALLVNYVGHASINRWAHEQIFVNSNIAALNNGDKLPVVLSLDCLDGYWFYPNLPSLTEELVRAANRGAIATFSPTGLGLAAGHDILQRGFYQAVFDNDVRALGPATIAAKVVLYTAGGHEDLINTFTVFGDPALQLRLPPVPEATQTARANQTATLQAGTATTLAGRTATAQAGTATAFAQTLTTLPPPMATAAVATGTAQADLTATNQANLTATAQGANATARVSLTATAQALRSATVTPTPTSTSTITSAPSERQLYLPLIHR